MPSAPEYELITRRLCLIKDTGHAGVLWGGTMMAWVDEAGAIYAGLKATNPKIVTRAFTQVDFRTPVLPGDIAEFWGRVSRWGGTSLAIDIRVTACSPASPVPREVLNVTAVFVAIADDGGKEAIKPAPRVRKPRATDIGSGAPTRSKGSRPR